MPLPEAPARTGEETAAALRERLRDGLRSARERTLALVEPVAAADMDQVHDPLMSPLAWDLGHIAAFEDLWACRASGRLEPLRPELAAVYDATETPRPERGDLPYLRSDEARAWMDAVRERTLSVLEAADLSQQSDPLNARGFVWELLARHELQHQETMLQALQLAPAGVYSPGWADAAQAECGIARPDPVVEDRPDPARVDPGPFTMGAQDGGFAYDNERPAHEVELDAFRIDARPVSRGAFAEFVEDRGYARPELWSAEGWQWRSDEGVERPLYWTGDGSVRNFDRTVPLESEAPVMNVSWFEADAFARWRGARLPTEAEWERASAAGVLAGTGEVWEWTASDFGGYPGFRAFPYAEYSEVFFGQGYRVLRGGSWATAPQVATRTFRNWDHPQRRQIFAGLRCAEDA